MIRTLLRATRPFPIGRHLISRIPAASAFLATLYGAVIVTAWLVEDTLPNAARLLRSLEGLDTALALIVGGLRDISFQRHRTGSATSRLLSCVDTRDYYRLHHSISSV